MFVPLLSRLREQFEELCIFGDVLIDAGNHGVYQTSELGGRYPARSTLKPFQFLATGNAILKSEKTAASMGSPSATLDQIESLMDWFGSENWEKRVLCPPVWPLDTESVAFLKDRGDASPIFGMCFAKHMAILEACRREKWDEKTYNRSDHPFHLRVNQVLRDLLGTELEFEWVKDGCSLLTPVLTTFEFARLYRALVSGLRQKVRAIRDVMMNYPEWIGGPGRSDTDLMKLHPRCLVAKEGADGLLCIGITPSKKFKEGVGVVIKLSHGLDHAALFSIACHILSSLGLKSKPRESNGQKNYFHFTPFITKDQWLEISPLNSEKLAVFPGDTPYRRRQLFNTSKGDHLSLSSIETTVHVGAHADAPNHFSKDKRGIDRVNVSNYLGPCQVVVVKKKGAITIDDLKGKAFTAPRVIFRTDSFAIQKPWVGTFAFLSEEVIHFLGEKGVTLVGIDTPSIDEASSKSLKSHVATLEFEMRILEGLDLGNVDEGFYDLFAVPLRLDGADASPVRALLRRLPYSGRSLQ